MAPGGLLIPDKVVGNGLVGNGMELLSKNQICMLTLSFILNLRPSSTGCNHSPHTI